MLLAPLKPYDWPQDLLQIPSGIGLMPPISRSNADVARTEYATFSADFTIPNNAAAGAVFSTIIATDQDGDFWCDQIAVVAWCYIGVATGSLILPAADLSVIDARTQRSLFYPSTVPIDIFRKFNTFTTGYAGNWPGPASTRQTGTLIQPFCFTRQGGISVSLTLPNATTVPTGSYNLTLMFSGWKEYGNASQ